VQEMAQRLSPLLSRKVIKQVVMTTVYGVTMVGARDQIRRQLNALSELDGASDHAMRKMSQYLAKTTLDSLSETSRGMVGTMKWMREAANHTVKATRQPLQWTMPLGLPVIQPYVKQSTINVRGVGSMMKIDCSNYDADPALDTAKQTSAFPPNFVHSIDASHMMMTANACHKHGLTFAAVHDSFWTHACDVDTMNTILRDEFIRLHETPLLRNFRDEQHAQHRESSGLDLDTNVRALPEPGSLDLASVKEAPYFFS